MEEEITGRFALSILQVKSGTILNHQIKVVSDNKIADTEIIVTLETIAKDLRKQRENLFEQSKYELRG